MVDLLSYDFIDLLANSIKDNKNIDKNKLKSRFTDVVMNSLSLIDDYLNETEEKTFNIYSGEGLETNHKFTDMIFENFPIVEDKKEIVSSRLIKEIERYLLREDIELQTGKLILDKDYIFIEVKKKNEDEEITESSEITFSELENK